MLRMPCQRKKLPRSAFSSVFLCGRTEHFVGQQGGNTVEKHGGILRKKRESRFQRPSALKGLKAPAVAIPQVLFNAAPVLFVCRLHRGPVDHGPAEAPDKLLRQTALAALAPADQKYFHFCFTVNASILRISSR